LLETAAAGSLRCQRPTDESRADIALVPRQPRRIRWLQPCECATDRNGAGNRVVFTGREPV